MRAIRTFLQALIGLVLVAIIWMVVAMVRQDPRIPMPGPVFDQVMQLASSGDYMAHVSASLSVLLYGLLPGLAAGVILGVLVALSGLMRWILSPFIITLAAAPLIALMPLLVLWLGLRPELIMLVVFIMTAFPVMNAVMVALATRPGSGVKRMAIAIVH